MIRIIFLIILREHTFFQSSKIINITIEILIKISWKFIEMIFVSLLKLYFTIMCIIFIFMWLKPWE